MRHISKSILPTLAENGDDDVEGGGRRSPDEEDGPVAPPSPPRRGTTRRGRDEDDLDDEVPGDGDRDDDDVSEDEDEDEDDPDDDDDDDDDDITEDDEPARKVPRREQGQEEEEDRTRRIRCWGWRKYEFSPVRRSHPGAPPGERHHPYDRAFGELNPHEVDAAVALGITDEDTWERSMPRRMEGYHHRTVGVWRSATWGGLSALERAAASRLGLTDRVWNDELATFHDDLWFVDGICMDPTQFEPVLRTVGRMATTSLRQGELARFLLDLERVLTPSQGREICRVLRSGVAWETLDEREARGRRFNPHLLVASFLSDPRRFVELEHLRLQMYWDDDNHGCAWGNASIRMGSSSSSSSSGSAEPVTYAAELKRIHDERIAVRRTAGPILVGGIPPHKFRAPRGSTRSLSRRPTPAPPGLPVEIARDILDGWLGEEEELDPMEVAWLGSNCFNGRLSTSSILDGP